MRVNEILSRPSMVLTQAQRAFFFEQGYIALPEFIEPSTLDALRQTMEIAIDRSRAILKSNPQFDLEAGHHGKQPRLRRVAWADDIDEACWQFCADSIMTDIATDILGPDIRFRDAFINFKWASGGVGVKWHQDIAFYPHTNANTCQFLVALEDVETEQGPLQIIPGSHQGPIYQHYDDHHVWSGAIRDQDLVAAGIDKAVSITGKAGTLSVHHSRTIHGSAENTSLRSRPMLVVTYSAADAIPYTAAPYPGPHYGALVRGDQPSHAHHEELRIPLPPDWSDGYTSIFTHQTALTHKNPAGHS